MSVRLIKGELSKDLLGHTIAIFEVDELMLNDIPYFNFWAFCVDNDLVRKWEPEFEMEEEYFPAITYVDLIWSKDEEKNEKVRAMFKKLQISLYVRA